MEKKSEVKLKQEDSKISKTTSASSDAFDYSKLELTRDPFRDAMRKKFLEIL